MERSRRGRTDPKEAILGRTIHYHRFGGRTDPKETILGRTIHYHRFGVLGIAIDIPRAPVITINVLSLRLTVPKLHVSLIFWFYPFIFAPSITVNLD
jgi:hypothetical protein